MWQVSDKEKCPIKVWKCQAMHWVFSMAPPVWFGRMGWRCTAALSVAMATSEYGRQRGPKGPALSLASQTAVGLRIDSIHMSIEAEQKWVSPQVEEKLKCRLTSLTLPGGERVKTILSWIDIVRDCQRGLKCGSVGQGDRVFLLQIKFQLAKLTYSHVVVESRRCCENSWIWCVKC